MSSLTPKHARFVSEYLVDLNATQAAIRAGYSARTADRQGHRLLKNAEIRAAVDQAMLSRREHTELTEAWTLDRLREVVERCMQALPMLDSKGRATGVYRFNAAGAIRGLELIGRHFGMFKDRLAPDPLEHLSDDELEARIAEAMRTYSATSH